MSHATTCRPRHARERDCQRPLVATWRTAIKGVCEFCDRFEGTTEETWGREVPGGPPAHEWCRCYLDWE